MEDEEEATEDCIILDLCSRDGWMAAANDTKICSRKQNKILLQ